MQKEIEIKLTYKEGTVRILNSLYGMKHNGLRAIKAETNGIEHNSKEHHRLRLSMEINYFDNIILN